MCDNTTGQVYFNAANKSYRVSSINAESLTFFIQVLEVEDCTASDPQANSFSLDSSSPFHLIPGCNLYPSKFSENLALQGNILNEVEIQWNPPPAPLCTSTEDCNDLLQATCNRTPDGMQRCICKKDFYRDWKTVTCIPGITRKMKIQIYSHCCRKMYILLVVMFSQMLSAETSTGVHSSRKQQPPFMSIFLGAIAAILLISCAIIYLLYLKKHRMVTRRGNQFDNTISLSDKWTFC